MSLPPKARDDRTLRSPCKTARRYSGQPATRSGIDPVPELIIGQPTIIICLSLRDTTWRPGLKPGVAALKSNVPIKFDALLDVQE
jgi:hypothetical protein